MSFGVIVLTVLATWSAASILVSVLVGAMASERDRDPAALRLVPVAAERRDELNHASMRRLAS